MINCYQQYCIENPYLLFLIIPLFILLIFLIFWEFLKFHKPEEKKRFKKQKRFQRIIILITRTLMILLILVAYANPFTTEEITTKGDPIIKLLLDNSISMNVFDTELFENVKDKLQGIQLDIRQISSGKISELGDGILQHIQGNDNLLIVSDGNNNFGKQLIDVGLYSSVSDTRLFAVNIEPEKNDAFVTIVGPSETIEGTQNRFKIKVDYVGNEPSFTLQVFIDDKLEFSGKNIFEKDLLKTLGEGYHKITAKIIIEDFFEENNLYYKTVKAVPKPRILFVSTRTSPLKEGLKAIYDFNSVSQLPSDLSPYSAIIFNDISYSSIKSRIDDLTGYLLNGKGILFIGGRNSFDKGDYKGSLLESMLPVNVGTGRVIDPLHHNIIITLDVSESFADYSFKKGGKDTALDFGKGLAVQMVESFRDDISIGLVAFASIGQIVVEPVELKEGRDLLINSIKKLKKGSGTSIDQGLLMADNALNKVRGTKNVILISDGKMGHQALPNAPISVAQKISRKGVRIYTVGLPSALYDVDVNRVLMSKLASIGNGNYFEPSEFQYLNVFFGKPEAKDKIFSGESNLAIIDREHFITKNLDLNARITGVNFVVPKLGARSLIFTGDGNPIVNSWNFGLGRVVSFATDDGSQWAGNLLKQQNSQLITRMINYVVGNPEKDKDIYIDAQDGFMGTPNEITVKSISYPVSQKLTFVKEGEDLYKADFFPDKADYYQFFDAIVAINPSQEYYKLGFNEELQQTVELSGGKMINLEDKDIIEQIQTFSERKEIQRKDLKLWPLGILLILFIIEIFIRKFFKRTKS